MAVDRPAEGYWGGHPPAADATYAPAGDRGAGATGRWQVQRLRGTGAALHDRPWPTTAFGPRRPAQAVPSVWLLDVERPALVLGSTQPTLPDPGSPPGLDVVRRHSGGGAVLLVPEAVVWIDALVPAGDRLWSPDVGHAFAWLGRTWVDALAAAGVDDARSHAGPLLRTRWSRQVCFAGLGPGEVTVGGRKVVGISQRRRRDGALFQCAALLAWDPAGTARALGLPPEAATDIAPLAAGLPVDRAVLETAFLHALAAA